uniref:TNFR-Cys domain-containing protein n=1 Tax=Astyanax mexicanus TaxID=7994 RepID=A0A8B9GWY6_ASTMX
MYQSWRSNTLLILTFSHPEDCTEFTTTTCVPCSGSSYTSQPNNLLSCLPCLPCDHGKVKTVCTRQSDAVCEPLEGFYCTDHRSGGCIQATEHSKCSPGEYIQQTEGTFSNGSLHTCQTHSQCEDQGLIVIKPGSNSSDAECGNKSSPALISGVTAGLIVVAAAAAVAAVIIFFRRIYKNIKKNSSRSLRERERERESSRSCCFSISSRSLREREREYSRSRSTYFSNQRVK